MKRDGDREFKSNDMQAIACNSRYLSRGSRKKDKRKTIWELERLLLDPIFFTDYYFDAGYV